MGRDLACKCSAHLVSFCFLTLYSVTHCAGNVHWLLCASQYKAHSTGVYCGGKYVKIPVISQYVMTFTYVLNYVPQTISSEWYMFSACPADRYACTQKCDVRVTYKLPSCAATGMKLVSKIQMLQAAEHKAPSLTHLLRKSKSRIQRSATGTANTHWSQIFIWKITYPVSNAYFHGYLITSDNIGAIKEY